MGRVFITGSADGLGLELGRRLLAGGHEVVLHGRSAQRAADARGALPGALDALAGDLSSLAQTCELAARALDLGPFDAVVHNAALGFREERTITEDGIEHVFAVNVLAPYVLTALVPAPRLVYLSSGLHRRGEVRLDDVNFEERAWTGLQAYSDSKLLDVALAFAVATRLPLVISTAVEPGWIATKMGGRSAPGTLAEGTETQLWLVTDPGGGESGRLYHDRAITEAHPAAADPDVQAQLLALCAELSDLALPDV